MGQHDGRVPDTFDVVVAGGGLVGASVAYELVLRGARTLLVDRHDAARATDAGAGILSAETLAVEDDVWSALAFSSAEHYRALVPRLAERGAGDPGYAECGSLSIAFREWDDDHFAATAQLIARRAAGVVEEISERDARAMFPLLGPVRRVLFNPMAARVDGRAMTRVVLHAARDLGLYRRPGSVRAIEAAGGRVVAVATDRERIPCAAAVVAGGAWSPELGAPLGVELPVAPLRGQIVHLATDAPGTGEWPILQPVLSYYVVPWPEGRLVVGGTMEPDVGFDASTTVDGLLGLLSEAVQLVPGISGAALREVRVGLRPASVDDAPILGPLPGVDGAFVATGHGANGLLLGPYTGKLVAEAVLGVAVPELEPFGVDRFAPPISG
jgi:D-amino-acid dehydrogenase